MRWWGKVLVVVTILATALAIISLFMWSSNNKVVIFIAIAFAVVMWAILILYDLIATSKLKRDLDKLISKGEWITARLTGFTETDIDKYDTRIKEWNTSVMNVLKGMEYEHSWTSDVGLTNPEDESQFSGLKKFLVIDKNYMYRRLTRLKEIKDGL